MMDEGYSRSTRTSPNRIWPAQLTTRQKKEQAREVAQSQAAAADRPFGRAHEPEPDNVIALRWPERARQGESALDEERRERRRLAVPQRPAAPAALGDRLRRTSLLLIPEDDQADEADR